jgi:hypothetical protein
MARPRLPQAKAEASGAALKNPGRFKGRRTPKSTRPIGKPYKGMTDDEVRYWDELVAELPWLHSGHRVLLRVACRLAAGLDGDDFGVSKAQALSSILSKLGATPVDETKVMHGDGDDEGDPAEAFFSRAH